MRLHDNVITVRAAKLNIFDEPAGRLQTRENCANGWKWEAEMPRAETRVDHLQRERRPGFVKAANVTLNAWQLTVSRRWAVADLPPEQLRDIGHVEAPAPVLEVKAGLVTNLMSMR